MKKIFCIISAVIIGIIGSFLTFTAVKKQTISNFNDPYSINVYYKSSTTANNKSYYAEDDVFHEVTKKLHKTLTTSLFTMMVHDNQLKNMPVYGGKNYASYDTTMKQKNLVVEFIYKDSQDIVVEENGSTRVIPYVCLLFIIPCNEYYEDIVVYTSLSNSQDKEDEYKKNTPFVLKGNPKEILKYAQTIG